MRSVIVQFASFGDRDQWAAHLHQCVRRIYKRNPWFAATVSDDDYRLLLEKPGVAIAPDPQLTPMAQAPWPQ